MVLTKPAIPGKPAAQLHPIQIPPHPGIANQSPAPFSPPDRLLVPTQPFPLPPSATDPCPAQPFHPAPSDRNRAASPLDSSAPPGIAHCLNPRLRLTANSLPTIFPTSAIPHPNTTPNARPSTQPPPQQSRPRFFPPIQPSPSPFQPRNSASHFLNPPPAPLLNYAALPPANSPPKNCSRQARKIPSRKPPSTSEMPLSAAQITALQSPFPPPLPPPKLNIQPLFSALPLTPQPPVPPTKSVPHQSHCHPPQASEFTPLPAETAPINSPSPYHLRRYSSPHSPAHRRHPSPHSPDRRLPDPFPPGPCLFPTRLPDRQAPPPPRQSAPTIPGCTAPAPFSQKPATHKRNSHIIPLISPPTALPRKKAVTKPPPVHTELCTGLTLA